MDLLLLMAASEDDAPKVAEVLRAGADLEVKASILPPQLVCPLLHFLLDLLPKHKMFDAQLTIMFFPWLGLNFECSFWRV